MSMMVSFVLSFFPRDVLDEILNLIGSVSEGFPSYSSKPPNTKLSNKKFKSSFPRRTTGYIDVSWLVVLSLTAL